MRCLLVSDLHYSLKQFDWVMEVADDFEVVVIAGDLLEIASLVDGRAQIVVVRKYLEKLQEKTRLVVCSGNHDLDGTDEAGEKTAKWIRGLRDLGIPVDGDSVFVGDALITVCHWWDGAKGRAAIGEQLAADAKKRRGPWIWVYHAPPSGSKVSWGGDRHYGDVELKKWIDTHRPDIVLSGHVHQAPFVRDGSWAERIGDTWVFNAGYQIGPAPAHVIFDLKEGQAAWFSLMGAQAVGLDPTAGAAPSPLSGLPDWLKAADHPPPRPPA
ncbi:MAG: metallophosphoesterase [Pseudomonadota bacterium]|nr:metallophosphoesterase [Pseudomonadota bacterium]